MYRQEKPKKNANEKCTIFVGTKGAIMRILKLPALQNKKYIHIYYTYKYKLYILKFVNYNK